MKKIITLILAMMMMLSVVMTGCTTEGGNTGSGGGTAADVFYEEGVTYSDNIGVYDDLTGRYGFDVDFFDIVFA